MRVPSGLKAALTGPQIAAFSPYKGYQKKRGRTSAMTLPPGSAKSSGVGWRKGPGDEDLQG